MTPPIVLTIAASDPLGGAGIQADLATFAAFGVHGTCAVTSITAQSLTAVTAVSPVSAEMLEAQIRSVVGSPDLSPAAVKTGLLLDCGSVETVAALIDDHAMPAPVVDPVMVDSRGCRFVAADVEEAYRRRLFPRARVITPNRGEAELMLGTAIVDAEAALDHAEAFRSLGAPAVVVTGGGFDGPPDDVAITADRAWAVPGMRIRTSNVRGSGCTFSAALACCLARGRGLEDAIATAGRFVRSAIAASARWSVEGKGPVAHTLRCDDHDWDDTGAARQQPLV